MSSRDESRNWRSSKERRFHHESRTSERRRPLEVRKRSRQRSIERRRPNEDRRHRNSSSSSHSTAEYRSGRRRRNRSSYDYYSGDDRRKRRRRRRSTDKRRSSSRRRAPSDHSPQRHRRRDYDDSHYRRRRRHSVGSSSPEARRRRRRRRRRRPRRRDASDSSPRPPPVAADVPPRAGVVSDDDDGAIVPAQYGATKTQTVQPTSGTARKGSSPSSGHDDTIGHFKGREGTVIADRYKIMGEVGVGTFGRVVECLDLKHSRSNRRDRQDKVVAIKIVRNIKRYYESALIEADIVEDVNRRGGRGVSHCAVMYNAFSFSGHYCMVFESLGPSLYDFLKRQNYQPFPSVCVREFAKQLLETLEFLHSFRLIHTDLKPENVLLVNAREVPYKGRSIPESTRIKVIDFGGATYDDEKKSSVVNTRQYRAPEVILGVGWSMPSDLWSVGCILAELYQGELLFATHDNIEHLALIERVVGPFPRRMLKRAKNTQIATEAFDSTGAHRMGRILPPESLAYVKRIGPLESVVFEEDTWFLRLLRRILVTDPDDRATARECLRKL